MSQQELMPEPQSSRASDTRQSQKKQPWSGMHLYPYNWPHRSKIADSPKSDHPSTFEESLPPYSYPAQDQHLASRWSPSEQSFQWQQRDAAKTRTNNFTGSYPIYSYYNSPHYVPRWTPSSDKSIKLSKWIGILLLVTFLLFSLPVVCSLGTFFVSIVFVFSFLPVLVALTPVIFFLLIPLLRIFGAQGQQKRWRQQNHYERSWW